MIVLGLLVALAGAPERPVILAQEGAQPAPMARPVPPRRTPVRRRPPQPIAPLPAPTPVPAPLARDLAPVPNRSIEGPRSTAEAPRPVLRPDLIEPRDLPDQRSRGGGTFTDRQDRLFRDPAAGARLNIPFSY
ncbi:hypothetical protein ACE7GA_21940 [Roseomonas sp. CCTCC AB2023176]|uniref:hypothetical protein n=1 Tax=Roseomonas sp. CCTCC AB2023176 TaxID=3342640 RepID=UPI0035E243CD